MLKKNLEKVKATRTEENEVRASDEIRDPSQSSRPSFVVEQNRCTSEELVSLFTHRLAMGQGSSQPEQHVFNAYAKHLQRHWERATDERIAMRP